MRPWLLLALVATLAPAGARADAFAGLARSLADMRTAVERLNTDLEDAKRARHERQRALAAQLAEAEAELRRETLRVRQMREALDRKRAEIERSKADLALLTPVVAVAAKAVRTHVARSMPFKQGERLEAIAQIERRLADNLLTPQSALSRLWALVEDELRLTRDTGLFRQTVTVDGREVLADVARIGMVAMLFRTGDGEVGIIRRAGGAWHTDRITDEAQVAQIHAVFTSFRKQIRVGWFQVPALIGSLGEGA